MGSPYREYDPLAIDDGGFSPCRCRSYRRGTLFQELDDWECNINRPTEIEFVKDIDAWFFTGQIAVRMRHTDWCIEQREADNRQAYGDHTKRKLTVYVMGGMDAADGSWWKWADEVKPPIHKRVWRWLVRMW